MDLFKAFVLKALALTMFVITGTRAATTAGCLGVISQSTGTCYTYHNSVVTWSEARSFCRAQGGHLAAITEYNDQDVLRYLFQHGQIPAGTTAAWIGAYHTRGEWTWVETGQVLSPQGCYTDRREDDQRDMEILINVPYLTPERCIDACRRISSPKRYQYAAVQGGFQCYCGNNTYGRYGTNTECTLRCSPDNRYYCGGSLMNFVYKIGGAYGSWAYAQPNNFKGNQNCGIIDTTKSGKMADESCYKPQAYMCEIVSASKATCLNSSSDYYYYEDNSGRCFYINETKVTWHDARERCHLLSNPGPGRLVTIDSARTHEIIRNIMKSLPIASNIWIGLSKGKGWQWTTGAAFNFSYWAPPSDVPGNPISVNTCGAVNVTLSNSWTDTSCDTKLPYICQSVKMGQTTKVSTPRRTSTSTTTTTTATTTTTTTTTTSTTTTTAPRNSSSTTTTTTSTTTTTPPRNSSSTTTTTTSITTTTPPRNSSSTTTTTTTTTTTSRPGDVPVPQNSTVVTPSEMPTTVAPPSSGQSTSGDEHLSTVELVLAIVMSLLGLIVLILCIYCLVLLAKKRNKVHYLYDARPIAREPNGGNTIIEEYDKCVTKDAMTSSTTELYRAAMW